MCEPDSGVGLASFRGREELEWFEKLFLVLSLELR